MAARKLQGSKSVEVTTALRAFEATFKAACRQHDVPAHKPLLDQLKWCQEKSIPCSQVVLVGQVVDGHVISAISEALASYAGLKTLSCLGCNIGDEGLIALSSLLKASAGRWWRGCRLSTLEICMDVHGWEQLQPALPERQRKEAHQQQEQQALQGSCSPARPSTAPTGPVKAAGQYQHHHLSYSSSSSSSRMDFLTPPPGVCPPVPAHLQLTSFTRMQLAQQTLSDRFDTDCSCSQSQSRFSTFKVQKPSLNSASSSSCANALAVTTCQVPGGAAGNACTWAVQHTKQLEACPRFGRAALQSFSQALGVSGLGLVRLVLDHTLLGDEGIAVLSVGLGKCSTLKVLSACNCNIGPAGAKELAAALTVGRAVAEGNSSSSSIGNTIATAITATDRSTAGIHCSGEKLQETPVTTASLELQELLLNGNPLTGWGLQQINSALRTMHTLKVLGLADICVTDADKLQLQGLVYALTTGPSSLQVLDFDNPIGDRCAMHFPTLLEVKPSLLLLKLSARISCDVMSKCALLMQHNVNSAMTTPSLKKKAASK